MTCCYMLRSAPHSPRQRSIFLQQMGINTNQQLEKVQTVKYFGALIREWDIFIKLFPSSSRNLCKRGSIKIIRARGSELLQENSVFQTQQDWWTHGDCVRMHRHAQIKGRQSPSTEQRKWTQSLIPNQEAIWNWYQPGRGKSVSPKERHWVC